MLIRLWSENLNGRDHSDDLDIEGSVILEQVLGKQGGKLWTGYVWLRVGSSGEFSLVSMIMNLQVP
jgi:hypothetical protein